MGYFANLATEYRAYDRDHSYTPPEKQLLWRLEALEDQLYALGKQDEGEYYSEDDLRYVLPEHFLSASNVRMATDLAICKLQDRYGICVGDRPAQEEQAVDEITGMQVTFFDILALQPQHAPQSAA